jgi:hypothetical protein
MEEAPANGKESAHSAHPNGMNELFTSQDAIIPINLYTMLDTALEYIDC